MYPKLFMILIGCTPEGRFTEQHDIFFTIANSIEDTRTDVINFWPEAKGRVHMDAWREVTSVDGYQITVIAKEAVLTSDKRLFFINLGGYRPGEFDEPHYKMLIVADDLASASKKAKETAFYKHTGFVGAPSHIDDKYGVDVDDAFEISEILNKNLKARYRIQISAAADLPENDIHLGYMPLYKK
jgi:hypothetical protein